MFLWCVQNIIFVWIGSQIFIIHSKFWVDGSCQDGSQQRFLKFVPEKFDQTYSLITSSSHFFHESWIYEFLCFFLLQGCKVSFSVIINRSNIDNQWCLRIPKGWNVTLCHLSEEKYILYYILDLGTKNVMFGFSVKWNIFYVFA